MNTLWNSLSMSCGSRPWFIAWREAAKDVANALHPGTPSTGPAGAVGHLTSSPEPAGRSASAGLQGKRMAMVAFSPYPADPRPRRTAEALLKEGMIVQLICQGDAETPKREIVNGIDVYRIRIANKRGGKLSYAYQYAAFILISTVILALRSLRRRYDLVYVNNMPDILVLCSLLPKMLGSKVILDLHDPMPEVMMTIYGLDKNSLTVRVIGLLEKWSIARANFVLTVNIACKRIFALRSCRPEKIGIVMNSPDEQIFPFHPGRSRAVPTQTPNKRFVIMYHGSMVERNGLDLAIDALEQAREAVPTAELRIYGGKTAFLERVMESVHNKGLDGNVRYLGGMPQRDLVREIEDCDVGIIPNHRNVFTDLNTPTRIFEYLILGKPVIAPRTRGIQDYFDPDSLLFFESGSSKELAQQIEYVFSHPNESMKIAKRGQQVYLAHTWSQERQVLVNRVSELLNGASSRQIPA